MQRHRFSFTLFLRDVFSLFFITMCHYCFCGLMVIVPTVIGEESTQKSIPTDGLILHLATTPESMVFDAEGKHLLRWNNLVSSPNSFPGFAELPADSAGRPVCSANGLVVEFPGGGFLSTKQSLLPKETTEFTVIAIGQVACARSLGILAFRDGARPFIQFDVDEHGALRLIARDLRGQTVSATTEAIMGSPTFFAGVFTASSQGTATTKVVMGNQTSESQGTLTLPVFGDTIHLGGLAIPGLSSARWYGSLKEILVYHRALSAEEIAALRDYYAKRDSLALEQPTYTDSWNILDREPFTGNVDRELKTDVCVVGGGSGGCAAAITAAREGAKVILVERMNTLGGTGTAGMVSNWEGGPGCSVAEELFERMKAKGGAAVGKPVTMQIGAPYGAKMATDEEPYKITLTRAIQPPGGYRSVVFKPETFDQVAREILKETDSAIILDETEFFQATMNAEKNKVESILVRNSQGTVIRIKADIFIDCTGSVWLCRALGCETHLGLDPRSRYNEPLAPEKEELQLNALTRCYRVEPRENPRQETPPSPAIHFPQCAYITGWLDGARFINMMPSMQGRDLAEYGYDECLRRSELIAKAHWHWLQQKPDFAGYELVEIAPMLGIRESHRVVTQYVLQQRDLEETWEKQQHPDMIAIADHPCDIHGKGGGLLHVYTAYGIPYRCLIPQGELTNLLVACRGAGFSRIAASSCRLQRTIIQLGHAAGIAAAWAAKENVPVDQINVPELVRRMDAHQQYPVKDGKR